MSANWYALRSKPRKENALYEQVRAREIEAFYPHVRVNPVNPRAARVRPFFPGYMFVRANLDNVGKSTFQWMPFSQGLVTFGNEPARVPDNLISGLRRRMKEISQAGGLKFEQLEAGAPIRVMGGPFKGYKGVFDEHLSGSERVRILLKLLDDRHMPLELHVGQVKPIKRAR